MSEVTLTQEQLVEALEANPEMKASLTATLLSEEAFVAFAETDAGKKAIQPKLDSFASQAINTWKNNNLDKIKQEAVLQANPSDTPEQRMIKELQMKFEASEKSKALAEQKAYAINLANQKGLPVELIDPFVKDNTEDTVRSLNQFEMAFKSTLQQAIEQHTGGQGRQHLPQNPNVQENTQAPVRSFGEMSLAEKQHLYATDRTRYEALQAQG